jgi:hypothetical protein
VGGRAGADAQQLLDRPERAVPLLGQRAAEVVEQAAGRGVVD